MALAPFGPKAEKILKDPKAVKSILSRAKTKAEQPKQAFEEFREELILLYEFGLDYTNKNYREVSFKSMGTVVFALLYFVVPTDVIPDFLLGAGYIDDSMVILWAVRSMKKEIDAYREWRNSEAD